MKVLTLYDYPASPGGLATQGDLLFRGLKELGVDAQAVHFEAAQEKEWYYRWFEPDVVVGIGYWGHTPHLVQHPQRYGAKAVPWLVADGYVANYQEVLEALGLVLVTSNWVREVYARDGVKTDNFEVLPVGCDTDSFVPRSRDDPKVMAVREALGVSPDQIMILTVGGDAASKGAQEVMQALALIDTQAPDWKYVCKVWPQARTDKQNVEDLQLAHHLGIEKNVVFTTGINSRNFCPTSWPLATSTRGRRGSKASACLRWKPARAENPCSASAPWPCWIRWFTVRQRFWPTSPARSGSTKRSSGKTRGLRTRGASCSPTPGRRTTGPACTASPSIC